MFLYLWETACHPLQKASSAGISGRWEFEAPEIFVKLWRLTRSPQKDPKGSLMLTLVRKILPKMVEETFRFSDFLAICPITMGGRLEVSIIFQTVKASEVWLHQPGCV